MTKAKKKLPVAASEEGHNPRWQFDCGNCKFNWCCGPTCACVLARPGQVGLGPVYEDPPPERQREVDAASVADGLQPRFRLRTLERLRDPVSR